VSVAGCDVAVAGGAGGLDPGSVVSACAYRVSIDATSMPVADPLESQVMHEV